MGPSVAQSAALEAFIESQKEIYHTPVVLGIKHFKRELAQTFPDIKKSVRNRLIASFKKRAWMEFEGISKGRGTFPVHPVYGHSIDIEGTKDEESAEYEIKVKNGNK